MGNNSGKRHSGYSLSFKERQAIRALVVEADQHLREVLRNALQSFGVGVVYCVSEHSSGLQKLENEEFTHVLYGARSQSGNSVAFLERIFEINPRYVCIAVADDPEMDEIFEHLRIGARSFITTPITLDAVEHVLLEASAGKPLSQAILKASNRNEAFSALLAASLNKAATAQRQALRNPAAKKDAEKYLAELESASAIVQNFCKGGPELFLGEMIEFFVRLAEQPTTRLGHLRKRLREERAGENS